MLDDYYCPRSYVSQSLLKSNQLHSAILLTFPWLSLIIILDARFERAKPMLKIRSLVNNIPLSRASNIFRIFYSHFYLFHFQYTCSSRTVFFCSCVLKTTIYYAQYVTMLDITYSIADKWITMQLRELIRKNDNGFKLNLKNERKPIGVRTQLIEVF